MILIHPSIDPVIFSFGFLEIRWYSMAYIAAFLIGSFLGALDDSGDTLIGSTLGALGDTDVFTSDAFLFIFEIL